jgi:hypothetical protein
MAPAGSEGRGAYVTYAYTYEGNPGTMRAPLEPGEYDLRYETGQSGRVLASRPIRVTPTAMGAGSLRVVAGHGGRNELGLGRTDGVVLILDASGSMLKPQDGRRRIDIAKAALLGLIDGTIPAGTQLALRVFGHREKDSCRTDLEISLGPLEPARARAVIGGIEAMNLARTPIGRSLDLVAEDLAAVDGDRVVVLVTDGEETCGGDPAASIETLRSAGHQVRVNIVGFAIDDEDLKQTFRYWANIGGGAYHDAADADELASSLARAVRAQFEVIDEAGQVVSEGSGWWRGRQPSGGQLPRADSQRATAGDGSGDHQGPRNGRDPRWVRTTSSAAIRSVAVAVTGNRGSVGSGTCSLPLPLDLTLSLSLKLVLRGTGLCRERLRLRSSSPPSGDQGRSRPRRHRGRLRSSRRPASSPLHASP